MVGTKLDWGDACADFLARNLPKDADRDGWNHQHSSAYQIACMALVALGYAAESAWGAVPKDNPVRPDVGPRWDDVCVSVLGLASQQKLLSYRLPDGGVPVETVGTGFQISQTNMPLPEPNIAASCGLGPALAQPDVLGVLERLELISHGRWTAQAEFVLWRIMPKTWSVNFGDDPRFQEAVTRTAETVPGHIKAQMEQVMDVRDVDIDAHIAAIEKKRSEYGANARMGALPTPDQAQRSIVFARRNELDRVFFRHWRMGDLWLSGETAKAALEIFHDGLAVAMRRAVIQRLYPDRIAFCE